jgi:hypothetical protein
MPSRAKKRAISRSSVCRTRLKRVNSNYPDMNQRPKKHVMKLFHLLCLRVASAAAFLIPFSAFSQGSLNPPGSPAPTMKRLDELEPRTNLQATPAPAGRRCKQRELPAHY